MTRQRLKFGIMNLFPFADEKSPDQIFRETLDEIAFAEELGFESVWLGEHHFSRYGILGNPFVFGAAIAQRTKKIRIGTAVAVTPFYDPIRLAEDAALLDCLSDGRLDLGYGRGYQPIEFAGFRIPQNEASERTQEIIDIVKLAWTTDNFSYNGKYYQLKDISVYPRPVQRPHPPLWRAAISMGTFEAAGVAGDQLLTSPNFTPVPIIRQQYSNYEKGLRENGHDISKFEFPMMQQVYVGESEQEAYDTPKPHCEWFYRTLSQIVPGQDGTAPKGYEVWSKIKSGMDSLTYDDMYNVAANFGTVEQVRNKLRYLHDELGMTHYIGWFNVGGLDHKKVMRSLERFAKEIMPEFQQESGPAQLEKA